MYVLVLNSGSSSLKFRLVDVADTGEGAKTENVRTIIGGSVQGIGGAGELHLTRDGAPASQSQRHVPDHAAAITWIFERLQSDPDGAADILSRIDAVGHRVVHGGEQYRQAVTIQTQVLADLDRLSDLAPLHNPACVAGIRAAQGCLGHTVPMVAVFDTAFHHTLPAYASAYAIPSDLAARHHIRRYGFHGIAHASMVAAYIQYTGQRSEAARLITLQLGNGCSATAINQGRSVDTSMGLTPLEGLVMGTRSGDLDPAVVSYLARCEHFSVEEIERLLNEDAGLLGVSGISHDMEVLLDAAEQRQDSRAAFAIELFCYRVRKYIGAYLAVLGGAEAIVFGGGIGEHAPAIRARICAGMEWCGLRLDAERNAAAVGLASGRVARVSQDEATVAAYVVAVDEETWIAQETVRCLRQAEHVES